MPKDAELATQKKTNAALLNELDFTDRTDFEDAKRGFIAAPTNSIIKDADGREVWNLEAYDFLKAMDAPATVNPSLWRQAQLNMNAGLFKVVDRIYQVRGLDASNMTIVEGDTTGLQLLHRSAAARSGRAPNVLRHLTKEGQAGRRDLLGIR